MSAQTTTLKWPEVLSLAALNMAVAISWIAYHEYQPVLVESFQLGHLVPFIVVAQAVILVLTPPAAGLLADRMMKRRGKHFIIFVTGISATAMTFMAVASIIGAGPESAITPALPLLIILWLVSMNIFVSPANSMIESFAPAQQLPRVMGVLVLVVELVYALEPLVVDLVQFFGETLTFIVGGVLISGTGYLFYRVSNNEVLQRREEQQGAAPRKTSASQLGVILIIGLLLSLGKSFLTLYLPNVYDARFVGEGGEGINGNQLSFVLLGSAAVIAFITSGFVAKVGAQKTLVRSAPVVLAGCLLMFLGQQQPLFLLGAGLLTAGFGLVNISGLPYAITHLTPRNLTYGVGIYFGASELIDGLMAIYALP